MEWVGTAFGKLPHIHIKIPPQQVDTNWNTIKHRSFGFFFSNKLIQHYSVTESAAEHNGASKHRINIGYRATATIL